MTGDERIDELLQKAGSLPAGLPPGARARLDALALQGARTRSAWTPAGIGIAAGVLIALALRPTPPAREPLKSLPVSSAWQDLGLPDGSAVSLAPETRLTLLGARAARLEEGTAWFAVRPGPEGFRVAVPGGRVEVVGTQFGVSVESNPKGEAKVKNPWMIGGAAAVVAVAVTSGVVHYVDASGPPMEVKADQRLEVDREGAKRLVALREKEEALQRQEKELAEREKGMEEKARLMAEREKAATQPAAVPAAPVAEAKPAKKKSAFARMMQMTAKMMDSPAAQEQMKMGMKMQIDNLYGDLLKEWALSAEARAGVEDGLIGKMMAQVKLMALLMDEGIGEDEILRKQDEIFAGSEAELAKHLSAEQLARLQSYEKEMPRRMQEQQADQMLASLGLDPAIQVQARNAIVEEQAGLQEIQASMGQSANFGKHSAEDLRKARALFLGDGGDVMGKGMDTMKASQEKIRTRLQALLTPDQLAAFQKQQDAQIQMMEMGMKMMESMGGGE